MAASKHYYSAVSTVVFYSSRKSTAAATAEFSEGETPETTRPCGPGQVGWKKG